MEKIFILGAFFFLTAISHPFVYAEEQSQEHFNYEIKGCGEGSEIPDSIVFKQKGSSLMFVRMHNTYCAAEEGTQLTYDRSGENIRITEIRTAEIAKCMCRIIIEGEIKNLTPGKYVVEYFFENRAPSYVKAGLKPSGISAVKKETFQLK